MPAATLIPTIVNNQENLYEGNLRYYFRLVFNSPNAQLPYHNFRHMTGVLCQTYLAARFYKERLDSKTRRALFIAAIFYDFGHSANASDDEKEVDLAISLFKQNILEEDKLFLPEIERLIRATQWPHVEMEADLAVQIIRDADLAQSFSDVWIQQIVFGLAAENKVSPLEMLKQQRNFFLGFKFNTDWAKKQFGGQVLADKLQEVADL